MTESPERELYGNGLIYVAASAVQMTGVALVLPVLTRSLGQREVGIVVAVTVIVQLLKGAAGLGLPAAISRFFFDDDDGRGQASRLVAATLPVSLVVTFIVHVTGPVWSRWLGDDVDYTGALVVAVLVGVPASVVAAGQAFLRVERRPGRFAAATLAGGLAGPAVGVGVVLAGDPTAVNYSVGLLAGHTVGALLSLWWSHEGGSVRPLRSGTVFRGLRYGSPTVLHVTAALLLSAADRFIIAGSLGLDETARYEVAYLVGSAGILLIRALNNAWSVVVFAATEDRWEILTRTTRGLTEVVASLTAAGVVAAPIILRVLAPPSYEVDGLLIVVSLAAASVIPFLLYQAHSHVLFWVGLTGRVAFATPIAALINVALNLELVPRFGLAGAALATVAAYGALWGLTAVSSPGVDSSWGAGRIGAVAAVFLAILALAAIAPTSTVWLVVRGLAAVALGAQGLARAASLRRRPVGGTPDATAG